MTAMNKGVLTQRRRDLEAYARVLPSLDLKRRQLAAMLVEERARRDAAARHLTHRLGEMAQALPMLAWSELPLEGGWQVIPPHDALGEPPQERCMGVTMPALVPPSWPEPPMAWPDQVAWWPELGQAVRELANQLHEIAQREQRIAAIDAALRQTVQRVNLFEQVLMPRARADIRAIRVFLADAERTAIVRAKQGRALVHRRMQAQANWSNTLVNPWPQTQEPGQS